MVLVLAVRIEWRGVRLRIMQLNFEGLELWGGQHVHGFRAWPYHFHFFSNRFRLILLDNFRVWVSETCEITLHPLWILLRLKSLKWGLGGRHYFLEDGFTPIDDRIEGRKSLMGDSISERVMELSGNRIYWLSLFIREVDHTNTDVGLVTVFNVAEFQGHIKGRRALRLG